MNDEEQRQQDLIERKAINLFCERGYPNPLHVFDVSPSGIPYINQEPITKPIAMQLKQEAGLWKSTMLYDVIVETIKQEAMTKAVTLSKNWDEVLAGKAMLLNLGIIKNVINRLSTLDTDRLPNGIGGDSTNMV